MTTKPHIRVLRYELTRDRGADGVRVTVAAVYNSPTGESTWGWGQTSHIRNGAAFATGEKCWTADCGGLASGNPADLRIRARCMLILAAECERLLTELDGKASALPFYATAENATQEHDERLLVIETATGETVSVFEKDPAVPTYRDDRAWADVRQRLEDMGFEGRETEDVTARALELVPEPDEGEADGA